MSDKIDDSSPSIMSLGESQGVSREFFPRDFTEEHDIFEDEDDLEGK
jgi:hypothetical protein